MLRLPGLRQPCRGQGGRGFGCPSWRPSFTIRYFKNQHRQTTLPECWTFPAPGHGDGQHETLLMKAAKLPRVHTMFFSTASTVATQCRWVVLVIPSLAAGSTNTQQPLPSSSYAAGVVPRPPRSLKRPPRSDGWTGGPGLVTHQYIFNAGVSARHTRAPHSCPRATAVPAG